MILYQNISTSLCLARLIGALILPVCAVSCGDGGSTTNLGAKTVQNAFAGQLEVELGNGFTYFAGSNKAVRTADQFSITNPLFISASKDRRYLIYSAAKESFSPEIFVLGPNGSPTQVTDNDFIEPLAVVNNNGLYAYLLHDHINDEFTLHLGDKLISVRDSNQPVTELAINESHLAIGMGDTDADSSHIEILDFSLGAGTALTLSQSILEKLIFLDESKLAIQIFDTSTRKLMVYIYDLTTDQISPLQAASEGDQHMRLDESSGDLMIDIVSGDPDSKMLFTALLTWKTHYLANAHAYSNNLLGRLSWTSSYVNEGLIGLYRVTGHPLFALQVRNSVAVQQRIRNSVVLPGNSAVPDFLWATQKYSLDRNTPLTLFVDDAKVLYPMLVAVNYGLIPPLLSREVILSAERYVEYIESQYNAYESLYHIRYGINFWLDGVWGPYNWQSSVGLVLIELFSATGNERYRERANDLARKFRSEWIQGTDNSIVWSYWPREYWAGWEASDAISSNMPSRSAWVDPYFEDLSHAGLNLKFVLEHRARFGPALFTDSDIESLGVTVENFTFGTSFSRFMSGNTEFLPALYRNLPLYGWSQLEAKSLLPYYSAFVPGAHPAIILAMTNNLESLEEDSVLEIDSYHYRNDLPAIPVRSTAYSMPQLLEYFGLR